MTSLEIRKNGVNDNVQKAIDKYESYAKNLTVVECSFNIKIDDIENYVNNYIATIKTKPIVMIDYLQAIESKEIRLSTKDAVDHHMRRLKQLQDDNKIVVIVISSLNRQNYETQIDYEAFKESGGIEYTADVIWGIQLEVLHDEIFDKASGKGNAKKDMVREAKAKIPRDIEFICLKNRFGISSYSLMFKYLPQFDYFVPVMEADSGILNYSDGITDEHGFYKVAEDEESGDNEDDEKLPFV